MDDVRRSDGATKVAYTRNETNGINMCWRMPVFAVVCECVCACSSVANARTYMELAKRKNTFCVGNREKIVNIFCSEKYFWHFQTKFVSFLSLVSFASFLFLNERKSLMYICANENRENTVTYIRLYLMALFSRRVFPFPPTLENATRTHFENVCSIWANCGRSSRWINMHKIRKDRFCVSSMSFAGSAVGLAGGGAIFFYCSLRLVVVIVFVVAAETAAVA